VDGADLLVDLLVQPRASRARIGPLQGDRFKVAVTAPPVEGAANAAVIELLAQKLGCPRRDVELVSGAGSRRKTVRLHGITMQRWKELWK
jgi:uncharacterized protein (TIGR00251 family)